MFSVSIKPEAIPVDKPYLCSRGFLETPAPLMLRVAQIAATKIWSPIVWRDGVRRGEQFLYADYCVADIDEGASIYEARRRLDQLGISYAIVTTKSHQKPKGEHKARDRYRVVTRFTRRIKDRREYTHNSRLFGNLFSADNTHDAARSYFPGIDIVTIKPGRPLRIVPPPPEIKYQPRAVDPNMPLPLWVKDALQNGFPSGERHRKSINVVCHLIKRGWTQTDIIDGFLLRIGLEQHECANIYRWCQRRG